MKHYNSDLEKKVQKLLQKFYLFRPDIGFKKGMEIYALVLSANLSNLELFWVFVSVMIDVDAIFAVFKAEKLLIE